MKIKKLKQSLLAFACAFAMMSTGLPVMAAEAAEPEAASLMSARLVGNCGCTITSLDYETVSKRNCVANGDGTTHTSEYYIQYVCPNGHGHQSKIEFIKETHVRAGYYQNDGHQKKDGVDAGIHVYTIRCTGGCGYIFGEPKKLTCMVPESAQSGHAVP